MGGGTALNRMAQCGGRESRVLALEVTGEMQPIPRDARLRSGGHRLKREFREFQDSLVTLVLFLASWAFAALPFLLLFWLMQPTVRANPGMSAHNAPPATHLEPPPRKLESLGSSGPPSQVSLDEFAQDDAQANLAQNYAQA